MSTKSSFDQNPDSLAEYVCSAAFGTFWGATEFGSSFASGLRLPIPGATGRRHVSCIETVPCTVRTILRADDVRGTQMRQHAAPHAGLDETPRVSGQVRPARRNDAQQRSRTRSQAESGVAARFIRDNPVLITTAQRCTPWRATQMSIVTSLSGREQQISALPASGRSSGSVV